MIDIRCKLYQDAKGGPPLDDQEVATLVAAMRDAKNEADYIQARNAAMVRLYRLAFEVAYSRSFAKMPDRHGFSSEDWIQEGALALVRALDTAPIDKAVPWCRQSIFNRLCTTSRNTRRRNWRSSCSFDEFEYPDFLELAAPHQEGPPDGLELAIAEYISQLNELERVVVTALHGLDADPQTCEEVAARFKVQRDFIRQLHLQALGRLRQPMRRRVLERFLEKEDPPETAEDAFSLGAIANIKITKPTDAAVQIHSRICQTSK